MKLNITPVIMTGFFFYGIYLKRNLDKLKKENLKLRVQHELNFKKNQIENPQAKISQDNKKTEKMAEVQVNKEEILLKLRKYFNSSTVELSVTPSNDFSSLYKLTTKSNQTVYIDKDLRHMFLGALINLELPGDQGAVVYMNDSFTIRSKTSGDNLNNMIRIEAAGMTESLQKVCRKYFP